MEDKWCLLILIFLISWHTLFMKLLCYDAGIWPITT